ncbi:MAG: hypothetical protein N2114_05270 [Candidatus Goldbacteria bacterium]|nr:hypothetical protein [Candidatus Goldiibacteriota bacterium]
MIKIGFELEINTYNSDMHDKKKGYHSYEEEKVKNFYWRFETDGSLYYTGIEIISPAFYEKDLKKIEEDLKKIMIKDYPGDWWIDERCGFHINFSDDEVNLSRTFLYKRLLYLRKEVLKWVFKEYSDLKFQQSYFRNYAKKIFSLNDYKKEKYLEFNIKENYIEWRSINLRHLIKIKKAEVLIREIIKLLKFLFKKIEKIKKIKEDEIKEDFYFYINENYFIRKRDLNFLFYKNYFLKENYLNLKKIKKKRARKIDLKFNEINRNNSIKIYNFQ